MVNQTLNSLKNINHDFTSVKQAADNFVRWAYDKLDKIKKTIVQSSDSLVPNRKKRD